MTQGKINEKSGTAMIFIKIPAAGTSLNTEETNGAVTNHTSTDAAADADLLFLFMERNEDIKRAAETDSCQPTSKKYQGDHRSIRRAAAETLLKGVTGLPITRPAKYI